MKHEYNNIVKFRIFNQEKTEEFKTPVELSVQQIERWLLNKLNCAKGENNKPIRAPKKENQTAFPTLQLLDITIEINGKRMIVYQWRQATKTEDRKDGREVLWTERGAFVMTKQTI